MMRVGDLIINRSKALLEDKRRAVLYAIILSILPFASWLSVALVALVTLRKGAKVGFELMVPALVVHMLPLMFLVSWQSALINTVIGYIPCYTAAIILRSTAKWQMVFGIFLIQSVLSLLLIQWFSPDFVINQFNQFKTILVQYQEYQYIIDGLGSFILAQLFLGLQVLSVIASALLSLLFARSIQAKLFVPGGFKNEILGFRSGKLAFLVLLGVLIASYYDIPSAINVLPLILSYFLISGLGLSFFILGQKRQVKIGILLFLLILLQPSFMLLAYIVFGSLDSLFNFRLYLPRRAKEST